MPSPKAVAPSEPQTHTVHLAVGAIAANPLNPRRRMDPAKLEQLEASVREHGVLQPILVRPHPERGKRGKPEYQLVCGERRWTCAKATGLETIEATVRQLDDSSCLEIMLVENGQRDDLEPMEEAETYAELQTKFGYTLERIAQKVGRSKTAVYQRLKLTALEKPVRDALSKGEIEVSVAELIGRSVHPAQQRDALRAVADNWQGPLSYRDAKRIIEADYMLRLSGVPWKLDDATLEPEAGPCTECPKRTGNQRELFPDTAKDVCLDKTCFDAKRKAARERRLAEAAANASVILEADAAKKIVDRFGDVKESSGYVNLDAAGPRTSATRPPKSYRELLGKKHLPPVTVIAGEGDAILEVARLDDVKKALKAKGIKPPPTERKRSTGVSSETKHRKEARAREAVFDAQLAAIVAKLGAKSGEPSVPSGALRAFATELVRQVWSDASEATIRRRGLDKAKTGGGVRSVAETTLAPVIRDARPYEVLALVFELLVQRHHPRSYYVGDRALLSAIADAYHVDLKAPERAVKAYLRALEKRRGAKSRGKAPRRKTAATKTGRRKAARRKKE